MWVRRRSKMDINFFNILSYFIIYSFLGWIMESVFRSICERKIINTGFLIGPVCPIYGVRKFNNGINYGENERKFH